MDPSALFILALLAGFIAWRQSKKAEVAKVVSDRLNKDTQLYRLIKSGMREYHWQQREPEQLKRFIRARHGDLLFETAHLSAVRVEHFAESRIGFYFKDTGEFGLYSVFVGNEPNEIFENYYRTDRTFQQEQRLLYEDD